MKHKKLLAAFVFVTVLSSAFISSCKKDTRSEPLEPISIIQPDSLLQRGFATDEVPLEIKFTTDRPINWVRGIYDIDTLIDSPNYVPTYPYTLFNIALDSLDPRVNLYTYKDTYHIPDSLRPYSKIRFRVSYNAGSTTFSPETQNYPAGIDSASKEFLINIK